MTRPTTTARAIARFRVGDLKGALRLAKDFRLGVSPADRRLLSRAYECLVRPEFFRQLGFSPEMEIARGRAVFLRLFCSQFANTSSQEPAS